MKKIVTIITVVVLMLCLTACGNKIITSSAGTAELPLKGFHGMDREIIIETEDQLSFFHQEFVFVKNAYHYQNGQLLKLEAFETKININGDVSRQGDISIPIKYFIYQSTVYPYINVDPHQQGISAYKMASIHDDPENVLIYSNGIMGVEPIIYNVISGEYRLLFTETQSCQLAFPAGIDADGQYVAVFGSDYDLSEGIGEYYVLNLKDGKSQKIPTPDYDKNKYTSCAIIPQRFIGNELLITYEIEYAPNLEENYSETYYYNLKNGELRKWDNEIEFDSDLSWLSDDYFLTKRNVEEGSITVYNLKTDKRYSYTAQSGIDIGGNLNESGKFLFSGYSNSPMEGPDENGNIVYADVEEEYQPFFVNLEKGEQIDITKHIPNFTIATYKGYPVRSKQWIDETNLLIIYEKDNVYLTDILDLKDAMN